MERSRITKTMFSRMSTRIKNHIMTIREMYIIRGWHDRVTKRDPVYNCPVYKQEGCAHVDGYLCDFPECELVQEFCNERTGT